jgi:hypothetical protein
MKDHEMTEYDVTAGTTYGAVESKKYRTPSDL